MTSISSMLSFFFLYFYAKITCKTLSKQSNSFKIDLNQTYNPMETVSYFTPEMAIYYSNFIGVSYCYQDRISGGNCCNEEIEALNWARFDSNYTHIKHSLNYFAEDSYAYNYQILFSEKYRKVLLLFPGTRSSGEFVKLIFNYASVPFNQSSTQKIFKFYNNIYEAVRPMLFLHLESFYKAYPHMKTFQTILAGHSLGGVISSVFAYDAVANRVIIKDRHSPVVVSLAQPRIGNSYLVDDINQAIPLIFRIVRKGDGVPQLPFFEKECKKGNKDCPDRTIYKYIHTKGLKMMNDDMSFITQCDFKEAEEDNNELCENKVNIFHIKQYHVHYFWKDKRIDQNCPEMLIKQSNKMKPS